ncbi:hypothetical protein [Microbacterium sp. USHLN272]|uniref:hypothetical protein n=1 Tax=Microbacterium sp. USHLN272 TaxID=3081287 RepID=UPI00301B22CE
MTEIADYVEHLPSGCALGRELGGEAALPVAAQLLREVEYTMRNVAWQQGGSSGTPPKRLELPKPADEARAEAAEMDAKYLAHQKRAARRS